MDFSVPGKISLLAALFLLIGSVASVTYQVEPEYMIPDADLDFESICISANPGLSCVSSTDGTLVQPFFLPATKTTCMSVIVKAFIFENVGYWKCIVVNVGPATINNPERVVLFGNDTVNGVAVSTLLPSFVALGPKPTVEARFEAGLEAVDSTIKAALNASVNLTCSSDSTSPSQFIWEYRNATNGLWRVFSHAQNVTVTGVFGELWCSAWNKLGPVRSASTLTIQQDLGANTVPAASAFLGKFFVVGPPGRVEAHTTTGETEVQASIIDPVSLYCTSDAAMPSRYIWEYRSATTGLWKIFHHGQFLTVRGVYGDLWCTAWNAFGPVRSENSITISQVAAGPATPLLSMHSPFLSSFVAVSEAPVISVDASFDTEGAVWEAATYNDTINLYCHSNASWFSRYIWFYRNNATGALRVLKAGQNATVHGLFGEFWCSVWNRFGSTASATTLQILHAPEWVDITTTSGEGPIISTLKNESVDLTCTSDAYPAADYRWEKRDIGKPWKVVALTQDILVSGKKGGEYVCIASNSLGEKRSNEVVVVVDVLKTPLLQGANSNKDATNEGVNSGIAIVGAGLVAAVFIMLVVLGVTVTRYRKRGTYKELKKTVQRPEDNQNAGEMRALIMGVPY